MNTTQNQFGVHASACQPHLNPENQPSDPTPASIGPIGPVGPIGPTNPTSPPPLIPTHEEIQTFYLTQTPDQIRATAEAKWPDTTRPKCPILARNFDREKQHYIAGRTEHEKERAALLAFAKFLALENNTPLRSLLETGEARVTFSRHRDALQPPLYVTEQQIEQAALQACGPRPSRDANLWQARRADFITFHSRRLLAHQLALSAQKRFSNPTPHVVPALAGPPDEKCKMLNDQCSMTPDQPVRESNPQPVHQPVHEPVQPTQPSSSAPSAKSAVKFPSPPSPPNQPAAPIDPTTPLAKFRAAITAFKTAIQTLDETGNPATVREKLFHLLTPVLDLAQTQSEPTSSEQPHNSHSSQNSQKSPAPSPAYDVLDQEIVATLKPRSKLDQLPADQQEILIELLQRHDARRIRPIIEREWNITTSASALNAYQERQQAKLDTAEQEKLQNELERLASKESPDYAQAAEKILQHRAIQTTRNKKSTTDEIYKLFTALTRYTNAQTSKNRLQFQIQKSSSGGNTALTNSKTPTPSPEVGAFANEQTSAPSYSAPSS